MKMLKFMFVMASLAIITSSAFTQETREQAVAGMRKTEAKEMDPTFTTAAPFAQRLVDDALAKHPEVLLLAIHAGPPKYDIVASNFGRIGKLGDEDDLRCIRTGKDNLEIDKTGRHYEDETPLRTKSGKIVGAIGIVFRYKPGDDKQAMQKIAQQISKEMQEQIQDEQQLLGPA
jgi:iron complex outermembrane receptor protein